MHSVKLGYLVCAVTVHLLLFLLNAMVMRSACAHLPVCMRVCVRTCTCDLSSKREHQFKDFGRLRSPGIETQAHSHTRLTRNLFLRFHIDTQPIPKIPHLHMIDKVARNICIL